MTEGRDPARLIGPALLTERLDNGMRRLKRPLEIEVDGTTWKVPEDSITDYSTIPSIGRLLVRWSQVDLAGVVHDHLYRDPKETGQPGVSRWRADRIWRRIAVSGKTAAKPLSAWLCWGALVAYGGIAWGMARKRNLLLPLLQAWVASLLLTFPPVFFAVRFFGLGLGCWLPICGVLATLITFTTWNTVRKTDSVPK